MKRFVKLFSIFTLLMSLLLITGCGRYQAFISVLDEIIYKGTTYVDNPTDASVTFTLDGTSYTVDAHSVKEIDLKEGTHTLVTLKGESKTFTVSQYDMKSILNPTETTYAIWYVQYGEGKVGNVQHGEVTTSIGNDVYVGPMITNSDIYIARRGKYPFRYGLDEPFDEEVYVNKRDPNEKGNPDALVFGKIYRPMEFKEAYPKLYKEYLGE